jgi:hypothetical protein
MSRHVTRRTGLVAAALLASLGLVVATVPAQGAAQGPSAKHKMSGRSLDIDWLEVGTLPGVQGNIHFGYLGVQAAADGETFVFGVVDDLQCDEGFVPEGPGGGHGGEEDFPCTSVGTRFIDGGAVTLTVDRKFTTGRLTGTLQVSDHDGTGLGNPPVDITLTGFGGTSSYMDRSRYTGPDGSSFTFRSSSTRREATVQGRIGPMVFDDEAGEFSRASMGTFREGYRQRIR